MKQLAVLIVLAVILISVPTNAYPERNTDSKQVRIGAFNFYPTLFQDKDGSVKGFYVDFLNEIAKRENWNIEYVYGNWADGLARIRTGEVDVLTNVALTPERAQFMEYGKVPLLTVWAELYVPKGAGIENIRDVNGKKIALMKGDFNAANFKNLVEKFGIPCKYVELGNFEEVFKAVASGQADGGVANNTFGSAKHLEYGLRSSGVIFNPFDIYFTVAKGKNSQLISVLDNYLERWKKDEHSPYHMARERWSHGSASTIKVVSPWLKKTAAFSVLALIVAVFFVVILRAQVRRRTAEVRLHVTERKRIEDALLFINESGAKHRGDQLLGALTTYLAQNLGVDFAFVGQLLPNNMERMKTHGLFLDGSVKEQIEYDLSGTPCENVVGKTLCYYPQDIVKLFPADQLLVEMSAEGYAATPLWDSTGAPIGVMGVISRRPLINQKMIETLLQLVATRAAQELEAMNRLKDLELKNFTIEHVKDAVYWITPDGNFWHVNSAASEMLGYAAEELLMMTVADVDPMFPINKWPEQWETIKCLGSKSFEATHRTKSGIIVPVEVTATYCRYGEQEYHCAIARDITERKRLEEIQAHRIVELTSPEEELGNIQFEDLFSMPEIQAIQDAFAQATGVASIITDVSGKPLTRPSNFSDLCLNIIRNTEKGLLNCCHSDSELGKVNPGGAKLQLCLSGGLWDGGASISVGNRHIANWLIGQVLDEDADIDALMAYAREIGADETDYRAALNKVKRMPLAQFKEVCNALFLIAGQLSRMAMQNMQQARNIAERQRAAAEREELIHQLQDKTAELERFIYTVSHDLKSPLITITGFLGFLREDFAAQDRVAFDSTLSRITGASEKMKQLLDELLELSRIGRKSSPPQRVDLKEVVMEAIELVSGRINEAKAVVDVEPSLPTAMVDRQRFLQVFENLIDNAVKFSAGSQAPRIQIGVRQEREEQIIFVKDNGIGIEPKYLLKVFDLFEKLDPHSNGTGVGLAIVHRIVTVHGGRMWAESDGLGQGSTFCFTIPQPKGDEHL